TGIQFVFLVLRIRTLVILQSPLLYLRLIKFDIGQFLAISRPVKGTCKSKFLLIYPVGCSVNNGILGTIEGNLVLGTKAKVLDKDIVIPHKGHAVAIGCKRCITLRAIL